MIIANYASDGCKKIFANKEHALIGISPFNSYYSESNIIKLLAWVMSNFINFHVFIPDTLPIYNFIALGYEREQAARKTKKQISYLVNKIYKSMAVLGFSRDRVHEKLINMSILYDNRAYIKIKDLCYDLYRINDDFKYSCDQCRDWILSGYNANPVAKIDSDTANAAVYYLLDEIPLFINSPGTLSVQSSVFIYHQIPEFIKYLYATHSAHAPAIGQGFVAAYVRP